ncbi:hypothetical protein ACIQOV_22200, partial [Kitasatospora sp. NPDC091257]
AGTEAAAVTVEATAVGLRTAAGAVVVAEITYVYEGELSAARCADLETDTAVRLVDPRDLDDALPPAWSRRLLAALHARVEGTTTELADGRPCRPGVLDRHRVLAGRSAGTEGQWMPDYTWDGATGRVRGWIFGPDGRVMLLHDPATGRTDLPGGAGGDDPAMALGAVAATTAHVTLAPDREVVGHHVSGGEATASVAARLRIVGPLVPVPCAPLPVRLLATPEQALELAPHAALTRSEVEDVMHLAHSEFQLPVADRRPVTEVPATGGVL